MQTPIFWAVTTPYSVFNAYWGGFNYHSADIMREYAQLSAQETANSIYIPMALMIGGSAFFMGLVIDRVTL